MLGVRGLWSSSFVKTLLLAPARLFIPTLALCKNSAKLILQGGRGGLLRSNLRRQACEGSAKVTYR